MKRNMGGIDRIIRVLFAFVVLGLFFMHLISGKLAIALLFVVGLFLFTSTIGWCPIYTLLGIQSCRKKV